MKKTITYKEIKDKVLDIINNGGGGGGGKSKLSELNDVTITSASNGQVLTYNGSKWVNANGGGGSNEPTLIANNLVQDGTATIPTTYKQIIVILRITGTQYTSCSSLVLPISAIGTNRISISSFWDTSKGVISEMTVTDNVLTVLAHSYKSNDVASYSIDVYGL